MLSRIVVAGGYRGLADASAPDERDVGAYSSVLSGDLYEDDDADFTNRTDNSLCVVEAFNCDSTFVLDGFTVTGSEYPPILPNPDPSTAGMAIVFGAPTVRNCMFNYNRAYGVLTRMADPRFSSCVFVRNSRDGMRYLDWGDATITNCTVSGNLRYGISGLGGHAVITNCIVRGNTQTQIHHPAAYGATVSYSCVQGGYPGTGNIDVNPRLHRDEFHLRDRSPCRDAGDPSFVQQDGETDIDGDPRVLDERVDMGADEVAGPELLAPSSGAPLPVASGR